MDAAGDADLASNPIRLSKRRITELAACERHLVATADGDGRSATRTSCTSACSSTCWPSTTSSPAGPGRTPSRSPSARSCAGPTATRRPPSSGCGARPRRAQRSIDERLTEKRDLLLRVAGVASRWWPRTQERVVVALAGGDIVLDGRADVIVGGRPTPWPAVVIEVKSGDFTREQRDDGLFYGLLLALRDGEAPAAAITTTPGVPRGASHRRPPPHRDRSG